jgi:7 transmembrane receptor (rhodopsin family)
LILILCARAGFFPLPSEYCLAWVCLDVLLCTASIMHLCTISVDRFLSLRYPMRFGRNKTRRRVVLKIIFVWLLSIAMSMPLSLMYSKVSKQTRTELNARALTMTDHTIYIIEPCQVVNPTVNKQSHGHLSGSMLSSLTQERQFSVLNQETLSVFKLGLLCDFCK